MRHKNDRFIPGPELQYFIQTFKTEIVVANGKAVIDQKNVRINMNGKAERKTDIHALGITAHRNVNEFPDIRELKHLLKLIMHFIATEIIKAGVKQQIVASGQLRMKTRAKVKQARHTTVYPDITLLRP